MARLANSLGNELVKAEAQRAEPLRGNPDAIDLAYARQGLVNKGR